MGCEIFSFQPGRTQKGQLGFGWEVGSAGKDQPLEGASSALSQTTAMSLSRPIPWSFPQTEPFILCSMTSLSSFAARGGCTRWGSKAVLDLDRLVRSPERSRVPPCFRTIHFAIWQWFIKKVNDSSLAPSQKTVRKGCGGNGQERSVRVTKGFEALDDFAYDQSRRFQAMLCWKGFKYKGD